MKNIFFLLIILASCNSKSGVDRTNDSEPILDSLIEKSAIKQPLLDSLQTYMKTYGDIPNPWNAPLIYFVKFENIDSKTTATIFSHIGLINFIDKPNPIENENLLGFFFLGKHPIVIYDIGDNSEFSSLIDLQNLSSDSINSINFFKDKDTIDIEWDFVPIEWSYMMKENELVRIK